MKYLILLICVFIFSCNTWKESLVKEGNQENAIHNAILDFMHTKKLFSQDSVFSIHIEDPLYSRKLVDVDERTSKWVRDKKYDDIIGISIVGDEEKIYHKEEIEIGSFDKRPSRFVIKDNKLFYWYDDNYPLSQETVDVLNQYNKLQKIDSIADAELVFDDGKKGATYHFCRNDLSRYKKEITTIAMGYDVPNLSCPK